MARQYLTTAIDFPNAAPHIGQVMEKILADVIARWFRLRGDTVRFHIGTDENGIKIQKTAAAEGITPEELLHRNVPLFESLFQRLGISYDYFIRTADPKTHWPTVTALWKKLRDAGALEKRTYHGLYCTGCEKFMTLKDLVDGRCPDHQMKPENVTEENWFFLLKRKERDLKKLLDPKTGTYRIMPEWRGNEVHSFLEQGLEDVSFSRSKESLTWGVPVPDDPGQVMYVWCDNLTSYISSLGFFTENERREWWDQAEVTHVIGKDIARFHALNWPAMLQVAGVRTPDRLLIHGFITSEGQKMSKTVGNIVDPNDVIGKYGVDPLRFYLSHEIPVGNDGDFSWKRFGEVYDGKLRNTLGNLLNRVLVLLRKEGGGMTKVEGSRDLWPRYQNAMDTFNLSSALQYAMLIADEGNRMIDDRKPWALQGEEKQMVLCKLAELLRFVTLMLLPFMPETAKKMATQLGLPSAGKMLGRDFVITEKMRAWGSEEKWKHIGNPEILFPPLS